jgi:hypothetical protein
MGKNEILGVHSQNIVQLANSCGLPVHWLPMQVQCPMCENEIFGLHSQYNDQLANSLTEKFNQRG